jgi:hypothetical protein
MDELDYSRWSLFTEQCRLLQDESQRLHESADVQVELRESLRDLSKICDRIRQLVRVEHKQE